jgi:hypothetical protein
LGAPGFSVFERIFVIMRTSVAESRKPVRLINHRFLDGRRTFAIAFFSSSSRNAKKRMRSTECAKTLTPTLG